MELAMLKQKIKERIVRPVHAKYARYKDTREFERHLRSTDVFIVGHPKSGNTWLCRMIISLLEDRFGDGVNLSNIQKAIPAFHAKDNDIALYDDLESPRFFRNEGPLYPELYPKTIYILRDPRSVYVSYYHHCVHDTQNHEWPIDDFVNEMLEFGCVKELEPYLVRWDKQIMAWLERSKNQPVHFVKYEDMHTQKIKTLKKVAEFVGIEYDQGMIENALEKSTFNNMRKEEVQFGAEPYSGDKGEKGFYVRKGKIDGWKDELPKRSAEKIQNELSKMMSHFGYS